MSKPTVMELLNDGTERANRAIAFWGADNQIVAGQFLDLAARVEKVLVLHDPLTGSEAQLADLCSACGELWPCSTVNLLNGEEEEKP